jgi:hypothetical protein
VHVGVPADGAEEGVDVTVGVGVASVVGLATAAGVLGLVDSVVPVGVDAAGSFEPPLQPDRATAASTAQSGPTTRTHRA